MVSIEKQKFAQSRAGLLLVKYDVVERWVRWNKTRNGGDSGVILAASEDRERRAGRLCALDERNRDFVGRGETVLGGKPSPKFRDLLDGKWLERDTNAFNLFIEITFRKRHRCG